jgi:hypothetical protein
MEADAAELAGLALMCWGSGFIGSYLILFYKRIFEVSTL